MAWVAVTIALAVAPAPPDPRPLRLIDRPDLHLMVRPAGFVDDEAPGQVLEWGAGLTLQVSTRLF